jgi:hypothetical protein
VHCNLVLHIYIILENKKFRLNLKKDLIHLKKTWLILSVFLLFALVGAVDAATISFDTGCDVSVTFVGSDAGYNNIFGWVSAAPPGGTLNGLGTGHGSLVNSVFPIGSRAAHEDIYLYITTNENAPRTYFSGPPSANPDSIEHASVTRVNANLFQVGFEDLYGGGDRDFDDVTLTVACSPIIPADNGPADNGPTDNGPTDTGPADNGPTDNGPTDTGPAANVPAAAPVPEFPTMALPAAFIIGMLGAVLFIHRNNE